MAHGHEKAFVAADRWVAKPNPARIFKKGNHRLEQWRQVFLVDTAMPQRFFGLAARSPLRRSPTRFDRLLASALTSDGILARMKRTPRQTQEETYRK
jgi:hypothetical protein